MPSKRRQGRELNAGSKTGFEGLLVPDSLLARREEGGVDRNRAIPVLSLNCHAGWPHAPTARHSATECALGLEGLVGPFVHGIAGVHFDRLGEERYKPEPQRSLRSLSLRKRPKAELAGSRRAGSLWNPGTGDRGFWYGQHGISQFPISSAMTCIKWAWPFGARLRL